MDPALITGLPVEEREYPTFMRGPRWRWWKPLVALLVAALTWFLMTAVIGVAGMLADGADLMEMARTGQITLGPWGFLANNVGLGLAIPTVLLVYWWLGGQRPRWLSSVAGGLRWGWLGRCLLVVVPVWLVMTGIEFAVFGLPPDIRVRPYTVLMIVGILLTTPFQAAGEEYLVRGFEFRLVGSYVRSDVAAFVVGTVLTSLTFMALHLAADPYLNAFYLAFGACAAWLTWRTGGLEAAIAIHVVNNMLAEVLMPFTDFSGMFNREVGTGDWTVLIPVGVLVAVTAFLTWWAGRLGLVRRSAPGRRELEALRRPAFAPPPVG